MIPTKLRCQSKFHRLCDPKCVPIVPFYRELEEELARDGQWNKEDEAIGCWQKFTTLVSSKNKTLIISINLNSSKATALGYLKFGSMNLFSKTTPNIKDFVVVRLIFLISVNFQACGTPVT